MFNPELSETRIALTWGDCGENHVGNQLVGEKQQSGTGVTIDDLLGIKDDYEENGGVAELKIFNVPEECPNINQAGVLVLRNFLNEEDQLATMRELMDNQKSKDSRNKKTAWHSGLIN